MSGINVLSDILKGGNKLEKTSTPKGKDAIDSPENVATVFAAMLSGFINSIADPKGQNSSVAGQESEEKKITGNPIPSVRNSNKQGSMLGYGDFALVNIFQPMLQSDLPAGKDANSGNDVSLGTKGLATANASLSSIASIVSGNNYELAMMNQVSLASDEVFAQSGMMTLKTQGDNPEIPELDKYRQVITDLLVALSGEIADTTLKPNEVLGSAENPAALFVADDPVISANNFGLARPLKPRGDNSIIIEFGKYRQVIEGLLVALSGEISNLSPKGNPLSVEGARTMNLRQEMTKIVQGWMTVMDNIAKEAPLSSEQNRIERLINGLSNISSALTLEKHTAPLTNVQRKSEGMVPPKGDSTQSTELSGVKDVPNHNTSISSGPTSNLVATNVADGKTITIPVWEQISMVIREQVMNRAQAIKELDIQLLPADLGKIQIGMRWENGQVHLVIQASEAATGQLLQNQLLDLRQNLTNQGVNCGMLQMGHGGEQQQNHRGDESQRTFNQNTNQNEEEDLSSVTNFLSLGQDGINRINVKA